MFADRGFARRIRARTIRHQATQEAFARPHPVSQSNGEEDVYPSYIANYSKGLPHNNIGEVHPSAYRAMVQALLSCDSSDFERIPLGVLDPAGQRQRRLTNPQAGLAWTLEGPDAQSLMIPPAPRIDDAQTSAEMAELYWMALLRDVSFIDYGTGAGTDAGPATTAQAVNSLSSEFTDYRGPLPVNAQTLFRDSMPGCLVGPYVSQFLVKDIPMGSYLFAQRQKTPSAGSDFMHNHPEWLNIQNGAQPNQAIPLEPSVTNPLEPALLHIRNLRDLTQYVHFDVSYQAYLNACFLLLQMHVPPTALPAGPLVTAVDGPPAMSGPLDPENPYPATAAHPASVTQEGFATFGNWHIPTLLAEVATRALYAMWFQKWYVHRRLRPEALGGLIHIHLRGLPAVISPASYSHPAVPIGRYPMIHHEILDSLTAGGLSGHFSPPSDDPGYFLSQAFPEGSPTHPSYGEGHAVVAGACVSILKAFFDGGYVLNPASANPFEQPQEPDANGQGLHNFLAPLTVGGELDKLASNIGLGGRCGAGVHYRSDHTEALRLGEAVAIGLLQEQTRNYNETDPGGGPPYFVFAKFDGTVMTI